MKLRKLLVPLVLFAGLVSMTGCGDTTANGGSTIQSTASGTGAANPLTPKGTVAGVLRDSSTLAPIAGATVDIAGMKATTAADGTFSIANVPANTPVGAAANGSPQQNDSYTVVIDMGPVNSNITSYNNNPANTTKKALYPAISYSSVKVTYSSLGSASGAGTQTASSGSSNTATVNQTSDTIPVNGFVANITPYVGKLSSSVTVQVVDTNLQPVANASVQLLSTGGYASIGVDGDTISQPGGQDTFDGNVTNLVQTQTSDQNGLVTFANVEALRVFAVRGTTPATAGAMLIAAPGDGMSLSYLAQQDIYTTVHQDPNTGNFVNDNVDITKKDGYTDALVLLPGDTVRPTIIATTPSNLADVAPSATASVVFTFSEPIQANTYALATTSVSGGFSGIYHDLTVQYVGPKAGNVAYTLSWNSAMTQLTVSFATAPTSRYTVAITAPAPGNGTGLRDASNNVVDLSKNAAVTFTTSGGLSVSAPVVNRVSPTTDTIAWLPVANAVSYNVYLQKVEAGITGPFVRIANVSNTVVNLDTLTTINFADGQNKVSYNVAVTAVNSEGTESAASNNVVIDDQIAPTGFFASGGLVGNTLAASGVSGSTVTGTMVIQFSQQMNMSSVQSGTYAVAFTNGATTITGVTFAAGTVTYNPQTFQATVPYTITNTNATATTYTHGTLTMSATDLNNNLVKAITF